MNLYMFNVNENIYSDFYSLFKILVHNNYFKV